MPATETLSTETTAQAAVLNAINSATEEAIMGENTSNLRQLGRRGHGRAAP